MYGVLEAISRCHFPYPVTSLGHSQRKKPRYQEASTLAQGHGWQRQEETSLVTGLRYSPGALAQACPFPRCPGSCPISHFQLLGFISRILISLSSMNSPTPALSFPSAKATPIYSCLDGPGSLSPSSLYSFLLWFHLLAVTVTVSPLLALTQITAVHLFPLTPQHDLHRALSVYIFVYRWP